MKNNHFILIKHPSETSKGEVLSAHESCKRLLDWGIWPLFKNTRCRLMVKPGNPVLIYTAGNASDGRQIIARATVAGITPWYRKAGLNCPILLEGIPESALHLDQIEYLDKPVKITDHLDDLSFIPENRKKWGVSMMGGMRSINQGDYETLSGKAGAA